jgi:hypothetical protein
MFKSLVTTTLAAVLLALPVNAQEAKPNAPKQETAEKPAPVRVDPAGRPVNIKLDLTITDQGGPGTATKKTVTMLLGDHQRGSIRSDGTISMGAAGQVQRFGVELNVDAWPRIITRDGDKADVILVQLALQYRPKPGSENATTGEGRASLNEQLGVILEPGKPILISQAADPTSDRKISVEVTATILK